MTKPAIVPMPEIPSLADLVLPKGSIDSLSYFDIDSRADLLSIDQTRAFSTASNSLQARSIAKEAARIYPRAPVHMDLQLDRSMFKELE
jgi:hypothetical protein